MKKLLSLVLICAMGLGMVSCVESEESPSVEAIRNAKAEQLKALSNLYNAQAEAEKVMANAEAALKNAQADYQKALADSVAQSTEQAKAKFAVEIEKIKAEAEAAIAKALKQAELHKQQMQANANQHIQDLYDAYTTVMGTLATEKGNLVTAKSDLLALELNVINTEDSFASTLRIYETNLAQKEAELEVLQDPKYTSINIDSIRVLWSAASKKATLDRSYYNNSEVVKAMNVALDTAEAVEGRFFTSIDDMNTFLKDMTDYTSNPLTNNVILTRTADYYNYTWWVNKIVPESVYIKGENLTKVKNALKEMADGGFWYTEETIENRKETLAEYEEAAAEAKEKYEAAEAFKAAIEPALDAKAEAIEALAEAWEKYNNVDGLADAVETAEGNVEDAEEALEDAEEALEAAQEELDEVKAIQPDLKALTDAVAAAEDVVEAKEEAKDDAVDAAADAQDAYDEAVAAQNAINQTQKPVEYAQAGVVVAQAYTALTAANAAVVEAQAAIDEAEALVVEAQAELDEFVDEVEADYNITLTGTAEQIAEAIANKVAQLEVNVYNKDVAKADAVAALAAAEAALAAAEAAVIDPEEAAEALVAADAAAKAAEAAVLAIITDEAYEVLELEEYDGTSGDYQTAVWAESAFNGNAALVLVDKNNDQQPDFEIDGNGVFTERYASKGFEHTKIWFDVSYFVENLENALQSAELSVAYAKDRVATAEYWVDQEGNDIRNQWYNNWDAKVAELNEWVEAKNAEIATVQAAVDAYNEAKAAAEEAEKPVIAIEAEANALLNMINNNVDLKAQIQTCEYQISWYKLRIEQIKDGIYTAEAAVEDKKVEIANLETKIAYLEKLLESAKAQLDAAVAADQAE